MRNVPLKRGLCPKESNRHVPLEYSLGPETHKILVINPVLVGKNRIFADLAMKTCFVFLVFTQKICENSCIFCNEDLFLWSSLSILKEKSFSAPPKYCLSSPSHVTLAPSLKSILICQIYEQKQR